jgi:hypothetical protein
VKGVDIPNMIVHICCGFIMCLATSSLQVFYLYVMFNQEMVNADRCYTDLFLNTLLNRFELFKCLASV